MKMKTNTLSYQTTSSMQMEKYPYPVSSLPRTVTKLVPYRIKKIQKENQYDSRRLTRDERAARDLNIPYTIQFIINCSMEEFNDILNNKTLVNEQINLCRDIRRRGKNKASDQKAVEDYSDYYSFRLLLKTAEKGRLTK